MENTAPSPQLADGSLGFTITAGGQTIPSEYAVLSIDTWSGFNRLPRARIVILDGDPGTGKFPVSSAATFLPGNAIEIAARYDGPNATIFEGIVVRQGIKIGRTAGSTLIIEASARAMAIGTPDTSQTPVMMLTYGDSIFDLELAMDAEAQLPQSWLSRVRGEVRFQGSALAQIGKVIMLAGLGDRFSGPAYISGVHHEINDGNWVTTAAVGPMGSFSGEASPRLTSET